MSEEKTPRLAWLDYLKAFAMAWIFLNHVVERIFGSPLIANPFSGWPPLNIRLAQLQPLTEYGPLNIPINLLRYLGWAGDQGVQLFLIAAGFGLTWGLLHNNGTAKLHLGQFYIRRAVRIFPLWWGAHLVFMALWVFVGRGLSLTDPATYLSLLGIRITPTLFYYFSPAWWYIGLIIQLYLIYPLLWELLHRIGPMRLMLLSIGVAFIARAVGLLFFDGYVDAWQRGAIFITRLPEFTFGISLAAWFARSPEEVHSRLRSPLILLVAFLSYIASTLLAITLLGMVVAPFILGISAFILLYPLLTVRTMKQSVIGRVTTWIGRHTYSLYLVHHPIILFLIPMGYSLNRSLFIRFTFTVLLTLMIGFVLEFFTMRAWQSLKSMRNRIGLFHTIVRFGVIGLIIAGLLVGGEFLVRLAAPQEVLGWGERPSLQPDSVIGWRLKPSKETRLRWESYDYLVTSNSLGYPGPEYPARRTEETYRIFTLGDAFTSAEGVNTEHAWPRLLEADLAVRLPNLKVEVQNFAVTGYGPNQYAATAETYVPIYEPDLIIIGFFVNEYQDVLWSNEEFRQSIGFQMPPQDGMSSVLHLTQMLQYFRRQIIDPLKEIILREPNPYGYFLGQFAALEKGHIELETKARNLVANRLMAVKEVAEKIGAQVIIVMIPAPVQACESDQLKYYPRFLDINESERYDLDLPQRLTHEVASTIGLDFYDLRVVLNSVPDECPYFSQNMHWNSLGHRLVSSYLAEVLVTDGYVGTP
ncbi:MAG: acyltransferase family protein [Anaerolineales bacterium]|nr:acyltransferase family protein [Anaerolineales bacterium]